MELLDLKNREVFFLGPRDSEWLFIQPVDEHDRAMPESKKEKISSLAPGLSFALAAFSADWDSELAPWDAEPVFRGQKPFSGGARTTLTYIEEELRVCREEEAKKRGEDAATRQGIYERYAATGQADSVSADSSSGDISVSKALQDSSGVETVSIYDRYKAVDSTAATPAETTVQEVPDTSAAEAGSFQ